MEIKRRREKAEDRKTEDRKTGKSFEEVLEKGFFFEPPKIYVICIDSRICAISMFGLKTI